MYKDNFGNTTQYKTFVFTNDLNSDQFIAHLNTRPFCFVFLPSSSLYAGEGFEFIKLSFLFSFNKYILITMAMPDTVLDIYYFSGDQKRHEFCFNVSCIEIKNIYLCDLEQVSKCTFAITSSFVNKRLINVTTLTLNEKPSIKVNCKL